MRLLVLAPETKSTKVGCSAYDVYSLELDGGNILVIADDFTGVN